MYNETQIRTLVRQRFAAILPVMAVGLVALFFWLGLLGACREFVVSQGFEWIMPFMVLPSILPFLLACWAADQRAKRFSFGCQKCGKDLTLSSDRILKTRSCSECGSRVVKGGKLRSKKTYARYCERRSRKFLVYWLWIWPAGGLLILIYQAAVPSAFADCPEMIFIIGLVGTVATGWALARTFDRRYLFQVIASTAVLILGVRALLA